MNIKDKKMFLLIIKYMFCMNKVSAIYNHLIGYMVYTLTSCYLKLDLSLDQNEDPYKLGYFFKQQSFFFLVSNL